MFQHLLLHDVIATLITLAFALLMDAIAHQGWLEPKLLNG